ncbi:MAG: hypothetical protein WBA67_04135 [Jannaschia sp.]
MEPVTLLLMSLGPTRFAIRRIASSIESAGHPAPVDFVDHIHDRECRASGLRALSQAVVRPRRLMRADAVRTVASLNQMAAAEGLMVSAQVSLAALFDTGGDPHAKAALEGRTVDLLLSTADGVPICGIDITSGEGPAFRDHISARAFRKAGLALTSIRADVTVEDLGSQLCIALGLEPLDNSNGNQTTLLTAPIRRSDTAPLTDAGQRLRVVAAA